LNLDVYKLGIDSKVPLIAQKTHLKGYIYSRADFYSSSVSLAEYLLIFLYLHLIHYERYRNIT